MTTRKILFFAIMVMALVILVIPAQGWAEEKIVVDDPTATAAPSTDASGIESSGTGDYHYESSKPQPRPIYYQTTVNRYPTIRMSNSELNRMIEDQVGDKYEVTPGTSNRADWMVKSGYGTKVEEKGKTYITTSPYAKQTGWLNRLEAEMFVVHDEIGKVRDNLSKIFGAVFTKDGKNRIKTMENRVDQIEKGVFFTDAKGNLILDPKTKQPVSIAKRAMDIIDSEVLGPNYKPGGKSRIDGISGNAILGIVLGIIALIGVVIAIILALMRRNQPKESLREIPREEKIRKESSRDKAEEIDLAGERRREEEAERRRREEEEEKDKAKRKREAEIEEAERLKKAEEAQQAQKLPDAPPPAEPREDERNN